MNIDYSYQISLFTIITGMPLLWGVCYLRRLTLALEAIAFDQSEDSKE